MKYEVVRDGNGHAQAIACDGRWILHLRPGTERNEENAEQVVVALNSSALLEVVLFVYAKNGRIKCLTRNEALAGGPILEADGWNHTATLDAARWIEYVVNDASEPSDVFDELQISPNTPGQRRP